MVGLSATSHINGLILSNPDEALAAAAALAAVGTGLTLRHVFKTLGMRGWNRDEQREIDLLDENAPEGFWHQAVTGVYGGLVASKFTPAIHPRLRWLRGLWTVDHYVNPGSELEPVTLVDLTTVNTPVLKGDELV